MKFICLIYREQDAWERLTPAQRDEVQGRYLAYTAGLLQGGHLVGGSPLHPPELGARVRLRDGRVQSEPLPSPAGGEQLNGYFLIEARDLGQAVELASGIPDAAHGSVEVRAMIDMPPPSGGA